MVYNQLILPDGSVLPDQQTAILRGEICRSVSEDGRLLPGGVCAATMEMRLLDPGEKLQLRAKDPVIWQCVEEDGSVREQGRFYLEKPIRPQADILVLKGQDAVGLLEKELTEWLEGLEGWPYTLEEFAQMVAAACGLTIQTTGMVNAQLPVEKFSATVTGRQLMRWICQAGGRFCTATPQGGLQLGWFTESAVCLAPEGEDFYYRNGLQYEDYITAEVDAARVRTADGKSSCIWPAGDGENPWILTGNPFFRQMTAQTVEALENIQKQLQGLTYTPCTVNLPARTDLMPGQMLQVTTPQGKQIRMCILESQRDGQKQVLLGPGDPKLRNVLTAGERAALDSWNQAAGAVENMTQEEVFDKLTSNGKLQGLFMENGQLYIHADYLKSGKVNAELIDAESLTAGSVLSVSGDDRMQIDSAQLVFYAADRRAMELYTDDGMPILYMQDGAGTDHMELSPHHMKVGGSSTAPVFYVFSNADGCNMALNGGSPKKVFWHDNGDGTFSLRGR